MHEAFRSLFEKAPSRCWIDHWNWNHCLTFCVEYFIDITETAGLLQVNLESRQGKPRSLFRGIWIVVTKDTGEVKS